jgi:predicted phage-related endonuclease
MRKLGSMLSTTQIQQRQQGLSATDIAKLSGENPWGGPIQVYEDKTSPIEVLLERENQSSNKEITGQILEAAIAKRYTYDATPDQQSLRILQTRETYQHKTISWAMATPNRFIFVRPPEQHISQASLRAFIKSGRKADWLLECEAVGTRVGHHWGLNEYSNDQNCDRIPPYVYARVQWQVEVCGYDRVDVAALLYGDTFKVFQIERDQKYIDALIEIGNYFWTEHVLKRIPPPSDGSDQYSEPLKRLYPFSITV